MLMEVSEEIPEYPNFKWMTLGQIKKLMEIDNLVNMDTRTVLAGIPLITTRLDDNNMESISHYFTDEALFNSVYKVSPLNTLPKIFRDINNYKMFKQQFQKYR